MAAVALASSTTDFYGALGSMIGGIGTVLAFGLAVVLWQLDVKRRRREREDDASAQARLVSLTIEPSYSVLTGWSPRMLGGLMGVKYRIANDSTQLIRHVELEIALLWDDLPHNIQREFLVLRPGAEIAKAWSFETAIPLPRGVKKLDSAAIGASIRFMDANGRWWGLVAGATQPHRLFPDVRTPFLERWRINIHSRYYNWTERRKNRRESNDGREVA